MGNTRKAGSDKEVKKVTMDALRLCLLLCMVGGIVCPPVKEEPKDEKKEEKEDEQSLGLAYERYLKEVVKVLEEDEDFKEKLNNANVDDIKSGDIARQLEFVSHRVRSKLDELKRKEIERLNIIKKMMDLKAQAQAHPGGGNMKLGLNPAMNKLPNLNRQIAESMLKMKVFDNKMDADRLQKHVDTRNPETFEIEDLRKLIVQATSDLEEMDRQRRDDFKTYEIQKEAMRREKLKMMGERERKEAEERFREQQENHKQHPRVNHPGSRDQLEQVWAESDGMDKDDFDPKTFFYMHDTNGDRVLDMVEVEALFQRELDKVYDENASEDDQMERFEEMSRMREHVYNEVDVDRDGLISLDEFMNAARKDDFDEKEPWDTLGDDEIFTEDELQRFEAEMRERLRQQAYAGHVQPGEIHIPQDGSSLPPPVGRDNLNPQHAERVQQFQQQQAQQQAQQQFNQQQAPQQQLNQQQQQQFNQQQQVDRQQQFIQQQQQLNHQQQQQQQLNQQQLNQQQAQLNREQLQFNQHQQPAQPGQQQAVNQQQQADAQQQQQQQVHDQQQQAFNKQQQLNQQQQAAAQQQVQAS